MNKMKKHRHMETKHIKTKNGNNKKKKKKKEKKLTLVLPRNLPPNSSPLVESRPKYSNMEQCQEEAKQHFF
jgi:hypothetical protein